jgi:hypothetical protein
VLWIGLAAVALLLVLALGRLGVWLLADSGSQAPVVYRRDALRELESESPAEPE